MSTLITDTLRSVAIISFLNTKIEDEKFSKGKNWLEKKLSYMANEFVIRSFFLAFSAAFRFFGKEEIEFTTEELEKASSICEGWNPQGMKAYEVARLIIFLHVPIKDKAQYFDVINKLFGAADMGEQVMLYRSLIVYPFREDFKLKVADGIRTNIKTVFEAIVLDNPYPAKYLDELQWNQMVLKSVFNGSPLFCIIGLEARANATLSQQLSDYAHERWAAGRTVNPELWRAAAPFTNEALIADYERLFLSENEYDQQAAALACATSKNINAIKLLHNHPLFKNSIESNELSWHTLSLHWYQSI